MARRHGGLSYRLLVAMLMFVAGTLLLTLLHASQAGELPPAELPLHNQVEPRTL